ncbi:MAG: protein kinase [Phycisphaerales bacterium JB040]
MPKEPLPPFDLPPGRVLAGQYVIERHLGSGYEGEVYRVSEKRTGALRAAKLFYPERNPKDRAIRFYAEKLERLRDCPILTRYHHSETVRVKSETTVMLVSELAEGVMLDRFVRARRGKRLPEFEALALLAETARGLAQIHDRREYHGDLHSDNIMLNPTGVRFNVKLIDFHNYGRSTRDLIAGDVADLIRIFYDTLGGKRHYASHSKPVKHVCAGLRKSLIRERFPTARHLAAHLQSFEWDR